MIRERIEQSLPVDKHQIVVLSSPTLYVTDWKNATNGGITFTDGSVGIPSVRLGNPHEYSVCCDLFGENALPIKKGCFSPQCECALFPEGADGNGWVLFVEMKYAKDEWKARDIRNDYPKKMVHQVVKTVRYFRDKQIFPEDKTVSALVSFPLLEDFNAWFDQNLIHDAFVNDRVLVRARNTAKVISRSLIVL